VPRSLIVVAGYDPGYLRITEHQVVSELARGRRPLVLDFTPIGVAPVDSFDRGTLRKFGLDYPGQNLKDRLQSMGAEVKSISEFIDDRPGGPLSGDIEQELSIAVQSALITYFRTDKPDITNRLVARTARGLVLEGRVVYRALSRAFRENPDIDTIYLPNGRFPGQKLAALAARDSAIAPLHFEKGETPNGTYIQSYAPQDRLASQGAVEAVLQGLSPEAIEEIADEWLSRRAPSKESRNEFAALWDADLPHELSAWMANGRSIVGLFTSSQDEFQFLGPEWQLHDWDDQFVAFDRVLTEFEQNGFAAYLRVHPNLATKAHDCFVRERAGIRRLAERHPQLVVIWHDDFSNTYTLLDSSDAVVVWDSTVGLEASARGIPVWTTATSRYGLVADVRELLSSEAVEQRSVSTWEVDPNAAKKFIAYLVRRDQQMSETYESWIPWDVRHPPLGVKLAAALVSGGTPHRSQAIKSILDVYRHRSLKSNLKHLRGR
jgi:hypothetical protein